MVTDEAQIALAQGGNQLLKLSPMVNWNVLDDAMYEGNSNYKDNELGGYCLVLLKL